MRQLGARLPEPPRAQTTREAQTQTEARAGVRSDVHTDIRSDTRPDIRPDTRVTPQHIDFADDRSFGLEAVPRQEGTPWGLLEPEREHRFPFLTLAVPGIAAVLALGALLWSGSLRDRVRQQDSAMNALQAQNQKLADTLEEMNVEQKASSALSSSDSSQPSSAKPPAVAPSLRQQTPPPQQAQSIKQSATVQQQQPQPAAPKPEIVQQTAAKVEAPPPVSQPSQEKATTPAQEAPRQTKPVETARAPEIVPPYPTNYRPLTATSVPATSAAASQPANAYHPPFSVAGSSAARSSYAAPPSASAENTYPRASPPPAALPTANRSESTQQYNAAGNGLYAGSLAENVQAVQGLQRHSTVPLQEFHVHEGMLTKITPALGLSVRHPDPGHGTYSLLVDGGNGSSYQLHGQVNNPLVFTDNTTHREYELVVLHIADRQVYGYVRAMR